MKKNKILLLILMQFLIISCDDILEEDITDLSVEALSPIDGAIIKGNSVNFRWTSVEETSQYRMEVLQGETNSFLVSDTLVSGTYHTMNLDVGIYRWRIRGENSAYETEYTPFNRFEVIYDEDLRGQRVELLNPTDDLYANDDRLLFRWKPLDAALNYDFLLEKRLNGQRVVVDQVTEITETFYEVTQDKFEDDAEYIWSIRGTNDISKTQYVSRIFFIDRSEPNKPELESPDDDEISNTLTVDFQWDIGVDNGNVQSKRNSVIQFSRNVQFETILEEMELSANIVSYTFENTGTFYWRIYVIDEAGNTSNPSKIRAIILE